MFVDDILAFSETYEDHFQVLDDIFTKLDEYGFTLKLSKCTFFTDEVEFLGFFVKDGHVS